MARPRCPVCRSKKWRKEPSSGLLICSEGHVLQGYRKETNEMTEQVNHVLRQRTLKKATTSKTLTRANQVHYHGPRAHYHYFQCLQLLLRFQIQALRKLWTLPLEFEAICRDLWALHLTFLPNPPTPEPLLFSGIETGPELSNAVESGEPRDSNENDIDDDDIEETSSKGSDSEGNAFQNNLSDPLEDISGEDENSDEQDANPHSRPKQRKTQSHVLSRPSTTISILVVACWMMRVPLTYNDLILLIAEYKLPYLDPIHRGILPASMTVHLTRYNADALSPPRPPLALHLHKLASRLGNLLKRRAGIVVPELNAAPILTRVINLYQLPAIFYPLVKILSKRLSISLSLHPSIAAKITFDGGIELKRQWADNLPVELAFSGTLIVLLKLIYGLDGRERHALSDVDTNLKLPSREEFLSNLRLDTGQNSATRKPIETVLDLIPEEMDRYLDFCADALLNNKAEEDDALRRDFFPIGPTKQDADLPIWPTRPAQNPSHLSQTDIEASAEPLHRASNHVIHSTTDILGGLPEEYTFVLTIAAQWCGIQVDNMALVVERLERRLVRNLGLQRGHISSRSDSDNEETAETAEMHEFQN